MKTPKDWRSITSILMRLKEWPSSKGRKETTSITPHGKRATNLERKKHELPNPIRKSTTKWFSTECKWWSLGKKVQIRLSHTQWSFQKYVYLPSPTTQWTKWTTKGSFVEISFHKVWWVPLTPFDNHSKGWEWCSLTMILRCRWCSTKRIVLRGES